jgi:molybdate transport system permease protein
MISDFSPIIVSLKTTLTATVITLFLGVWAAWAVVKNDTPWKGLIDGVLTLPLVLPPTIVGFFLILFFGKNGPLGPLFESIGFSVIFSWTGTVIAATIVAFPMMYKSVRSAFEQLDHNVLDAATLLGVSDRKIFARIVLPMSWPGIAAGTVLAFARALGEFGATIMVSGNIPGKTQTIPLAIYFATEGGDMASAYMWVGIIFAISLSVMVLLNYWNGKQSVMSSKSGRKV